MTSDVNDGYTIPQKDQEGGYNAAYSEVDDDYYYTGQYWAPAEKKTDLLEQLKKLKISTVMREEIQ